KFNDLIAANGEVEKVEKWGTRQLAYAIDKKADGYYALITFTRHWAKYHKTLSCISPLGSTRNPAAQSATPATSMVP
nr:30S ribosomal protein S6 [Oscillospiraceae bacterium]